MTKKTKDGVVETGTTISPKEGEENTTLTLEEKYQKQNPEKYKIKKERGEL